MPSISTEHTEPLAVDQQWDRNEHGGRIRANHASRHDIRSIPIGDDARLDIFWKHLDIGYGPAVSVVIHGEEILRVDCFGPDDGHMHVAFFMPDEGTSRLYFPENTRAEQIDRGLFEINRNLRYYLDRAVNARIRATRLDPARIEEAAAEAGRIMTGFLDRVESPDTSATPAASADQTG